MDTICIIIFSSFGGACLIGCMYACCLNNNNNNNNNNNRIEPIIITPPRYGQNIIYPKPPEYSELSERNYIEPSIIDELPEYIEPSIIDELPEYNQLYICSERTITNH